MNNRQIEELLRRLARENQDEAMKAWLTFKVQQQKN